METNIILQVTLPILTAFLGYLLGTFRSFTEAKNRAYEDLLPPIVKFAYHRDSKEDEKEFSKALCKLWLYGNREVAMKMEIVCKIIHGDIAGNVTNALQDAIAEMRKNIQIWPWQEIKPEEIRHIYTTITGEAKLNAESLRKLFGDYSTRIDSCISDVETKELALQNWEVHKREINNFLSVLLELFPSSNAKSLIERMTKEKVFEVIPTTANETKACISFLSDLRKELQILLARLP